MRRINLKNRKPLTMAFEDFQQADPARFHNAQVSLGVLHRNRTRFQIRSLLTMLVMAAVTLYHYLSR